MLMNSILVLAILGNTFVNSFIYQQFLGVEKQPELLPQTLQDEQKNLRITKQVNSQEKK